MRLDILTATHFLLLWVPPLIIGTDFIFDHFSGKWVTDLTKNHDEAMS